MLAVGSTGNASLNNNWSDTFTDPQMGSFLVCTTSAQATTEPSTIQLLGCSSRHCRRAFAWTRHPTLLSLVSHQGRVHDPVILAGTILLL